MRPLLHLGRLLPLLIALIFVWPTDVGAQTRTVELSDLAHLVDLRDPQIAPDGGSVVLVVSRPNYEDNRFEDQLVQIEIATGEQHVLTPDRQGVKHPRWSPSGDRLAFLANDKDGKAQIYVLPMRGGEARQITTAVQGVSLFAWKPDGEALAFVTEDEPEEQDGEERHNKSFEVGDNWYLADEAPMPSHLWLIAATGGDATRLTKGTDGVSRFFWVWANTLSWSPDGRFIAFTSQPRPHSGASLSTSIQVVNVATGEKRILDAEADFNHSFGPNFSPDGKYVSFLHPRGTEPGFSPDGVFVVPSAGGEARDATAAIDRNAEGPWWMPDSQSFLVLGNDGTRISLWLQPLSGAPRRLELSPVHPLAVSVGSVGELVLIGSEPQRPSEVYYMSSVDSPPKRITSFNDSLASLNLGEVASITWQGPDGFQEDGVLTYPPAFSRDRKYPLVLLIHGGPMAASTEAWGGQGILRQLMAAQGWVVFSPNYRGSNNLGSAYQRAVINDAGDGPGRDVMAGIAAVKALGFVDENRLAVSGWSYGGFMTVWLSAHYPVWKAAVAGAAVTDWFDWYNLADLNVWAGYGLGGSPWLNDNVGNYLAQSPITYAHRIRTPTLILSNTLDPRVTVTQSYKLYHALKDNGTEVKFIAYPVPGHFPRDPVHQRDVFRRWIGWIEEHLNAPSASQ